MRYSYVKHNFALELSEFWDMKFSARDMEIYSQNLRKYFRIFSENRKSLLKLLSLFWQFVFLPTHARQYNVSDGSNRKPKMKQTISI